jgi:hypothetical protein
MASEPHFFTSLALKSKKSFASLQLDFRGQDYTTKNLNRKTILL